MRLAHSSFVLAAVFAFSGLAFADPVVGYGVFSLSGTVVGIPTGLDFYFATLGDEAAISSLAMPTGAFSGLTVGTIQTIQDLTAANHVTPGPTSFDFPNWIQLTKVGIDLDATSIPIETAISSCVANTAYAVGAECRPNAGSPVILTQNGNGVSATLEVNGVAHYGSGTSNPDTPFVGLFNAPSTNFATISDLLVAYQANGGIPDVAYTGTFTTSSPIPEPVSLALAGLGLLGLSLFRALPKKGRRN